MVPIYDSDLADKRWEEKRWENYEFWEDIEARERSVRRRWIAGAVALFLVFSSIAVSIVRFPKWRGIRLARELALSLNQMKREASFSSRAVRVSFVNQDGLRLIVEGAERCDSDHWEALRETTFDGGEGFRFLESAESERFGFSTIVDRVCYDPFHGARMETKKTPLSTDESQGIVILPAKDLTSGESERLTVVGLHGTTAEISFE